MIARARKKRCIKRNSERMEKETANKEKRVKDEIREREIDR